MSDYLPVFIFAAMVTGFAGGSLAIAAILRPSRPETVKLETYECGAEPIGQAWIQFPVGFYLVAILFLVFDALAVFLFPWALALRPLGLAAFLPMVTFLVIPFLGWRCAS